MSRHKKSVLWLLAGSLSLAGIVVIAFFAFQKNSPSLSGQALAYGESIHVANVHADFAPGCDPDNVVNDSGMSGAFGKTHTHDNRPGTMWCVETNGERKAGIVFDFGEVVPLGEMWVWNYSGMADGATTKWGMKDVAIFYSTDGEEWHEAQGDGHPYQFAQADGSAALAPTNLNDGEQSPVRFDGVPARFVKVEAEAQPGSGNWASDTDGDNVFGLSEVRFYRYAEQVVYDGIIHPVSVESSNPEIERSSAENVINHYGMSGVQATSDQHGNDPDTMWLATGGGTDVALTVDLGGTYPLKEMWVWNYNGVNVDGEEEAIAYGLKNINIYHSIDGEQWTVLNSDDYPHQLAKADGSAELEATNVNDSDHSPVAFGGVQARYVKRVPHPDPDEGNWGGTIDGEPAYGLSEVRFYSDEGFAIEPDPDWTALFSHYSGWSGADGIYSIPFNGYDAPGKANETDTLFLFSDTFVGNVNPVTKQRPSDALLNNTIAVLNSDTPDPSSIEFRIKSGTNDVHLFTPHVPSASSGTYWYWLQDGIIIEDTLYIVALMMERDPSGTDGFQFAIAGVNLISVPMDAEGPIITEQVQIETPFYYRKPDDSAELVYGAGIMDNTEWAGAPDPDGYIYIYGYWNLDTGMKQLTVARVQPEQFEKVDEWRFWDGSGWSAEPENSVPLIDEVSPELSVTPITAGALAGQYVLVFERDTLSGTIAYSVSETPYGPFTETVPIYYTDEIDPDRSVFSYNAKAHPHLSEPGELLISYNVNTTDHMWNMSDADIYRPRFIKMREIRED